MAAGKAWLDPKTQEALQSSPPERAAPPTQAGYSLVLLEGSRDRDWMSRAVERVLGCSKAEVRAVLDQRLPVVLADQLAYEDAMLGQFELTCCDAVAVFLRSEIIAGADADYLRKLYEQVRQSDEFEGVAVAVEAVPITREAMLFTDQFLWPTDPYRLLCQWPVRVYVSRKKARIMEIWGRRCGAQLLFFPLRPDR